MANEDGGVTTTQANSAMSSDAPRCAAAASVSPAPGVPNKPMVPTAHDASNGNSLDPLRRHIGRPLDRAQGGERRAAKDNGWATVSGRRAVDDRQRTATTSSGQRLPPRDNGPGDERGTRNYGPRPTGAQREAVSRCPGGEVTGIDN